MSSPPPTLSLPSNAVAGLYARPGPESQAALVALINDANANSVTDSVLDSIIYHFILSAFAQPTKIDSLIDFLASVASRITPSLAHPGNPEEKYMSTPLRPSTGPNILSERLSHTLYGRLWQLTSRAVTPDEDYDKTLPKKYYIDACVISTILARAFATQPVYFRDSLWREVEDVIVKSLFSGPEQEPGVFVALSALLLGAGSEIREYLGAERGKRGQGKGWLWYDDVRTQKDAEWGWEDIIEALLEVPEEELSTNLPDYVEATLALAKVHVGHGDGEIPSWDSDKLAQEAFNWL